MTATPARLTIPPGATAHLTAADPTLASLIARLHPIDFALDADLWRSLVGAIVGQQLSVKAAAAIRSRLARLGDEGFPTPSTLLAASDERLRECGLSRAKSSYLRDLATHFLEGRIEPAKIARLPDEMVIERLVEVRGIGRWTAEMALIFCLGRGDVLALDDLGLRTAVQRAYRLPERPGSVELAQIGEPWRPYRSYASLYLWDSLKS